LSIARQALIAAAGSAIRPHGIRLVSGASDQACRLDPGASAAMLAPLRKPETKPMRRLSLAALAVLTLAASAAAQPAPPSSAETRELLEAAKATAKATRDSLDYVRVTPDLLYQILAKLDKVEGKLDKIENAIKDGNAQRPRR
jgi:hypothetical protein